VSFQNIDLVERGGKGEGGLGNLIDAETAVLCLKAGGGKLREVNSVVGGSVVLCNWRTEGWRGHDDRIEITKKGVSLPV